MLHIGCHLSISKGFLHIGKEALSIGADTFQFFTRNPQGGQAKDWSAEDIAAYRSFARSNNFAHIVAHAPYTLNPCSDNQKTLDFALMCMADDLHRISVLPEAYYNFHPGSHVGQGIETGIVKTVRLLNKIMSEETKNPVLIETMSGKGSEIGATFEQIAEIISGVKYNEKLGVCLDTCHIFAGGYDIVNKPDEVLREFDRVIGLNRLYAVHLNDSLMGFASHKDRHAQIGKGEIGADALRKFVAYPEIMRLPLILETPNDLTGYAEEITFLRNSL